MCARVCIFWFWNACFVLLSLLTLIFFFLFKKLSWEFVILFMRFLRFFPCCKCGLGFGTFSVFCYFFADLSTVYVLRMSELQFRFWSSATSTWKRIIVHVSGKPHGKNLKKDKLERATIQDCILFFAFCFPACAAVSQTLAEGNHVHQSGFIESFVQCSVGSYLSRLPLLWTPCSAPLFLSSCNDKCYTAPSISLPCILSLCMSLSVTICQRVRPVLAMDSKSTNVSNVIHVDIGCDVRFLWIFFVISIGSQAYLMSVCVGFGMVWEGGNGDEEEG